MHIEYHRSRIY